MPGPYGGQSQQRWGDNTISAGEYIRDIMLTDLSGRPTGTGDARRKGAMVLLAFFGLSDAATPQVLPALRRLADGYKESGKLVVLGVSLAERAATQALASQLGVKFSVMLDHEGYHAMVYGVTATPTVFLVDAAGMVLSKFVGFDPAKLVDISAKIASFAGVAAPVDPLHDPAPAELAPTAA